MTAQFNNLVSLSAALPGAAASLLPELLLSLRLLRVARA